MLKIKNKIYKILVLIIIIPIITIFIQSVILRYEYKSLLPDSISLISFKNFFTSDYIKLLLSSIFMSIIASILTIIVSMPLAKVLSEVSIKIKNNLYVILITPLLIPQFVYFYGMQNVFMKLNIINTYIGVILSHIIIMMPYAIINISNDMSLYGKKYTEVAYVMGVSDIRLYIDIILPIIKKTIINTFALLFIISFSQYLITIIIGGGVVKTYAMYLLPLILGNDRNYAAKATVIYVFINVFMYMVFINSKREEINEK